MKDKEKKRVTDRVLCQECREWMPRADFSTTGMEDDEGPLCMECEVALGLVDTEEDEYWCEVAFLGEEY